jgi:hypothetical protein
MAKKRKPRKTISQIVTQKVNVVFPKSPSKPRKRQTRQTRQTQIQQIQSPQPFYAPHPVSASNDKITASLADVTLQLNRMQEQNRQPVIQSVPVAPIEQIGANEKPLVETPLDENPLVENIRSRAPLRAPLRDPLSPKSQSSGLSEGPRGPDTIFGSKFTASIDALDLQTPKKKKLTPAQKRNEAFSPEEKEEFDRETFIRKSESARKGAATRKANKAEAEMRGKVLSV